MLGFGAPVGIVRALVQQPQLAAQETLAPVGPGFAAVFPPAGLGVHGEEIGVSLDQAAQLRGGEVEGAVDLTGQAGVRLYVGVMHGLPHAMIAARSRVRLYCSGWPAM